MASSPFSTASKRDLNEIPWSMDWWKKIQLNHHLDSIVPHNPIYYLLYAIYTLRRIRKVNIGTSEVETNIGNHGRSNRRDTGCRQPAKPQNWVIFLRK